MVGRPDFENISSVNFIDNTHIYQMVKLALYIVEIMPPHILFANGPATEADVCASRKQSRREYVKYVSI